MHDPAEYDGMAAFHPIGHAGEASRRLSPCPVCPPEPQGARRPQRPPDPRCQPWLVLCAGCVPSVTARWSVLDPRRMVTCTLSPGWWSAIAATRSLELLIVASPSLVTTSPALRPVPAAGPPAVTWPMAAPPVWLGASE